MTEQPTDPTAIVDFVMACADAWIEDERDHDYATWTEYEQRMTAARWRLQQAVEWAMARAAADAITAGVVAHEMEAGREAVDAYEADAAEKWEAQG